MFIKLMTGLIMTAGLLAGTAASAQDFPDQQVNFVVAYAAGGGNDTLARLLARELQEVWKQPVIVENRPGGDGVVGATFVSLAEPDGYTLLFQGPGHTITPHLQTLSYDPIEGFEPVTVAADSPHILAIHPSVPANSFEEFIAYCKANPGTVKFGSTGNGTTAYLLAKQTIDVGGCQSTIVPYKGSGQSSAALLGNEVQALFSSPSTLLPMIKDGRVKGIATDSPFGETPDLAVVPQTPGFENFKPAPLWYGILAPAGTPKEIVKKLRDDFAKVLEEPEMKSLLAQRGMYVTASEPDAFHDLLVEQMANWGPLLNK